MNIMDEAAKKVLNAATQKLYALDVDECPRLSGCNGELATGIAAALIEVSMQLIEAREPKDISPQLLIASAYIFTIAAKLSPNIILLSDSNVPHSN